VWIFFSICDPIFWLFNDHPYPIHLWFSIPQCLSHQSFSFSCCVSFVDCFVVSCHKFVFQYFFRFVRCSLFVVRRSSFVFVCLYWIIIIATVWRVFVLVLSGWNKQKICAIFCVSTWQFFFLQDLVLKAQTARRCAVFAPFLRKSFTQIKNDIILYRRKLGTTRLLPRSIGPVRLRTISRKKNWT